MADETTGWGGEFHLHNGTALIELVGVIDCGYPTITVDQLETSNLKSPDKFKEYIGGMLDGGEFGVTMNYTPRSATDQLCSAAIGQVREFMIVEPEFDGAPSQEVTGTVLIVGYEPSPMKPNEVRTATLRCKVTANVTKAAA